jgi:hypothetical protein
LSGENPEKRGLTDPDVALMQQDFGCARRANQIRQTAGAARTRLPCALNL